MAEDLSDRSPRGAEAPAGRTPGGDTVAPAPAPAPVAESEVADFSDTAQSEIVPASGDHFSSVGYEPSPSFGREGGLGLYQDDDYASDPGAPVPGEPPLPDLSLPPLDLPGPGETVPERITLTSHEAPEMPHWTDPPTGEVPRILLGQAPVGDDDLGAWQALGSRGTRWRDEAGDWGRS